jgi:predicted RNA-binding Zn-ribbon protein involved in translation (DUF1610 family)
MSRNKDKDPKSKARREDCVEACEQLLDEAVNAYEGMGEFEFPQEADGAEYNTAFLKPIQGRKVWVILALILVGIAVAVLYVYQAGDRKTILGNQPIPAGQPNLQAVPVIGAQNVPMGGAQNVPMGGQVQPPPAPDTWANGGAFTNVVTCPHCALSGLPVCSSCGAVMKLLGDGSGLFVCTSCGVVGVPICPRCRGHMTAAGSAGARTIAQPAANTAGQFQCPACRATGLPNWDRGGVPKCPSCGTTMKVRGAGTPAAAGLQPGG